MASSLNIAVAVQRLFYFTNTPPTLYRSMSKLASTFYLFVGALFICTSAFALDAGTPLRELNHTVWTDRDGAPTGAPNMAQTPDGWMWFGSKDGLFRFDGVKFERVPLSNNQINELHVGPNGDLLISHYFSHLEVLHPDGRVENLGLPQTVRKNTLNVVAMDGHGVIWGITDKGVYRFTRASRRWEVIEENSKWSSEKVSLLVDQYDQVWVSNYEQVFMVDRAAGKLTPVPGDALRGNLTQSPDGRIWVISDKEARVVPAPHHANPLPRRPDFNQIASSMPGQFDYDGNLWLSHCPLGICRIAHAGDTAKTVLVLADEASERLDQYWQLSSVTTNQILEDREGNIWVVTPAGIDRFRTNKLVSAHVPASTSLSSMAIGADKSLWTADFMDGSVWHIPANGTPIRDPKRRARVVANDRDGAVLFAGTREIERFYHGTSTIIGLPMPHGKPTDLAVFGVLDDGKVLWMVSPQTGLMGLVDGVWRPRSSFNLPPSITAVAPGSTGQLWLGNDDGKLRFYDNGKLSTFDISIVGRESGFFPGPQLVVGGELGIAVMRGEHFELLGSPNIEALRNVTGMTTSADGDRWLNGSKGIVHIRRDDWDAALNEPSKPLRYELLGALDGYPGRAAFDRRLSVLNGVDGRIWFRTSSDIVLVDPSRLSSNTVKPTVRLLALNTAGGTLPVRRAVRLLPNARTFNIQYTAPGLRKPEGMRFQYRLEGMDKDWQDAGTRRAAYYTNVGPGRYTFRVRAMNEDGVASDDDAIVPIEVIPTITETMWFRAGLVMLAILASIALHRYRLRTNTLRITRQMQARVDERERIARTLHDTFLQSIHALSLQLYAELIDLPEKSSLRGRLQAVLDRTNLTIDEGRAQVQQLRVGADPEEVLVELGELMKSLYPDTAWSFYLKGVRRSLAPVVQEELAEIGREAIRNAFNHAAARKVTVMLGYRSDELTLTVCDDGRGFDPEYALKTESGVHWGIVGMRERASRLGGQLNITSTVGSGTSVELKVRSLVAYSSKQ